MTIGSLILNIVGIALSIYQIVGQVKQKEEVEKQAKELDAKFDEFY